MKKILVSAVSLLALASAASAADLPSRKEAVIPAPAPLWTGFYAGLNAGYSWGTNSNTYSQNWASDSFYNAISVAPIALDGNIPNTQSGFMGGAQFGYNYQYGSNIVLGVETDIQGSNVRGTGRSTGMSVGNYPGGGFNNRETTIGRTTAQAGLDYLGTIRGRVGYLWSPALLLYGTAGFAYGGAWANVVQAASTADASCLGAACTANGTYGWTGGGQQNQLLTGWTAGGGVEWLFMPNWSLKTEALYWDLGRMNINTTNYSSDGFALGWGRTNVNYSGVVARAGINYHFNFGAAPVVAKF
jgi:outer membrane immunogenic protein